MIVKFKGQKIKVTPVRNPDNSIKLFKGDNRNYYPSEVIYIGCPQLKK